MTKSQLIEVWETYLMQLDADEDGSPFFNGPGAPAAASEEAADETVASEDVTGTADEEAEGQEASTINDTISGTTAAEESDQTDSHAAAIATAEAEE